MVSRIVILTAVIAVVGAQLPAEELSIEPRDKPRLTRGTSSLLDKVTGYQSALPMSDTLAVLSGGGLLGLGGSSGLGGGLGGLGELGDLEGLGGITVPDLALYIALLQSQRSGSTDFENDSGVLSWLTSDATISRVNNKLMNKIRGLIGIKRSLKQVLKPWTS